MKTTVICSPTLLYNNCTYKLHNCTSLIPFKNRKTSKQFVKKEVFEFLKLIFCWLQTKNELTAAVLCWTIQLISSGSMCACSSLCSVFVQRKEGCWRESRKHVFGSLWLMQPRGKTLLWRSSVASAKARFPPQAFSPPPLWIKRGRPRESCWLT